MKKILSFLPVIGALVLGQSARAQSYTYTVENSKAIITGFATGSEPSGAIAVPSTLGGYTVTQIGRSAFKDKTAITSITFTTGANVIKIGVTAFQGCTALQTVALPSASTVIPTGLFQGCTSLSSVTIPGTVTGIGDSAFADCRSLVSLSLPAALTSLGESAFLNCRSLTSLSIPSGVTSIPGQLCQECRALATVSLPAGVTTIGYSAFSNCISLASFSLPESVISLGHDAFHGCEGMTAFAINGSLSSMGDQAFLGCGNLAAITVAEANATYSSVNGVLFNKSRSSLILCPEGQSGSYTIPSTVTSLATGAFAHCDGLTEVSMPGGITGIGEDAFYYASNLETLAIPAGTSSIAAWAFAGCSNLTGVTIPAAVTSIANDAFHYNSSMTWAVFDGSAPTMGSAVFDSAASGFTIYFHSTRTGFTTPTWLGYASSSLDIPSALVSWLTGNGFTPGAALLSDSDGDGVNLLMAYALGLDPNLNLAGSMPQPILATEGLSLTFHGNSEGISYSAEASTDLETWSTDGVSLSDPDGDGLRTATMATGTATPARFMRLVVNY